jgi:hypothetical protein
MRQIIVFLGDFLGLFLIVWGIALCVVWIWMVFYGIYDLMVLLWGD